MKTLIIPDIHTKVSVADAIVEAAGPVDETVYLGDYFDEWGDDPEVNLKTGLWLRATLAKPNVTMLLGNHDVSYAAVTQRCSGWTQEKQDVIGHFVPEIRQLKLWQETQGWLLSHAGVGQKFAKVTVFERGSEFIQYNMHHNFWMHEHNNQVHPFGYASGVSGGRAPFDGPLWHRPASAWSGDKYLPLPQVFGHTFVKDRKPVLVDAQGGYRNIAGPLKAARYNRVLLDTNLRHYAVITDGTLKVHEVPRG